MAFEVGYLDLVREGSRRSLSAPGLVLNAGISPDSELVAEGAVRAADSDSSRTVGVCVLALPGVRTSEWRNDMPRLNLRRLLALAALASCQALAAADTLQLVRDLPLPGRATRWDYMSLDAANGKLALAHLGDDSVVVVSTESGKVLGTVGNVRQVHGVLAVPELGRIFATATGSDELVVIDESSLAILARVPVGRYPDGLAYAPRAGKVYVSDKEGKTESVIDVRTHKRVAVVALGGTVGNSQYDPISGHVYVNVEGTGELVELDPATDKIVGRIRLPNAVGNHGLLIEPEQRLAFIACEGNDKLLVLDLRSKRVTAEFPVGGEPDVLAYDPGRKLLYVATESGPVHMFRIGPDGVTKAVSISAGRNAHTIAADPRSHEVYLPLNQPRPTLRVMRPME